MEFNTIKKTILELSPEEIECLGQAQLIINYLFHKMKSEDYTTITDGDYISIGAYDLDVAGDILRDLVEKNGLELIK